MALTRVYTFVTGSTLTAAQLNNEFDNVVNLLNGTLTSAEVVFKNAASATAVTVNQTTAAQHIADFQVNAVTKLSVNDLGQLESVISTGTAPFVVASTTKVANLNADLLDGIDSTGFLRYNFDGTETLTSVGTYNTIKIGSSVGGSAVELESATGTRFRILSEADEFYLQFYDGVAPWEIVAQTIPDGLDHVLADAAGNEYATQAYADAKRTVLSFGAFYNGEPTTAAKQGRWVVPSNVESALVENIDYIVGVAGTGTTTIRLEHYNSAGVLQTTRPVSILAATVADAVNTEAISDISLTAGDYLMWTVTGASGTHQDISIWAQGSQEVI